MVNDNAFNSIALKTSILLLLLLFGNRGLLNVFNSGSSPAIDYCEYRKKNKIKLGGSENDFFAR